MFGQHIGLHRTYEIIRFAQRDGPESRKNQARFSESGARAERSRQTRFYAKKRTSLSFAPSAPSDFSPEEGLWVVLLFDQDVMQK